MFTTIQTVYVAMSGGVDSSVAAALLKQRGFKVVGVFFKPWQPKKGVEFCHWKEDRQEAIAVATVLGIPFKTWDFSKEYEAKVGDYMVNAYREGLTPNPDVMCNKEIKFSLFLKRALAEGADFIATGHYARRGEFKNLKLESYKLLKAKDQNKDQTYFLWMLTQKELRHSLFPIGDYTKPEVRKMAKQFGLPNHAKKDSQGICFIGPLNIRDFLKFYIRPKPGKIKLLGTEEIVGEHEGVYFFTIGQRHGLDIHLGRGPYYVTKKNLKTNTLYVSRADRMLWQSKAFYITDLSWVGPRPKLPLIVKAKPRYRTQEVQVKITEQVENLKLEWFKPVRAVTPGQSVVFYQGQEVLGGGVILPQ